MKSTRRRRFSLPPLDDDHEKVNRSIESFLAGGDPSPDPGIDAAPTTVALVALAPATEDGPIDPTVADTLERELRGAARGPTGSTLRARALAGDARGDR